MAKQRINTPFVIMLVVSMLIIVAGGAIFYFQFLSRDSATRAAEAQAYFDDEEYALAIEEVGKAISHDPTNVDLLQMQFEFTKVAPVNDFQNAQKRLNTLRSLKQRIATLRVADPEAQRGYYAFLNECRVELSSSYADLLYSETNERLGNVPDDLVARKYRGIAVSAQISSGKASDSQREQGRADLLAVLEEAPDDTEALYALAMLDVVQAERIARIAADDPEITTLRQEAESLLGRLLEAAGDNIMDQLNYVTLALNPSLNLRESAVDVFGRIEGALAASGGERTEVLTAIALLQRGRSGGPTLTDPESAGGRTEAITEDLDRAVDLCEAILKVQPENGSVHLRLASLYRMRQQPEKAVAAAEKAGQLADVKSPPIQTLLARQTKLVASIEMATSLFLLADGREPEQREGVLNKIDEIVKELKITFPENPQVIMLAGKLAFARQDFREAAIQFDKASSMLGNSSYEALILLARTHRILRQWGEAASRLESILAMQPGNVEARQELISVYIAERNPDEARRHIEYLISRDPENVFARQALAQIIVRFGSQAEQEAALEQMKRAARDNDQPLSMVAVQLMRSLGRDDEARDALLELNALQPNTPQIVGQLVPLLESKEQKTQLVDEFEAQGGDEKVVRVLRALIEESDLNELVPDLVSTSPFARARSAARQAMVARDMEAAQAAIDEAEQLEPDSREVIDLKFDFALIQEDWNAANQLVEIARQRNLDKVQGKFYRARVLASQQRYEDAAIELNAGLEIDRVNPEIRTMLAKVYRQQGLYEQAIEQLNQALAQKGDNLDAISQLASIRNQQGQPDQALDALRRAYQLRPNNERIRNLYLLYETQYGQADLALEARERLAVEEPNDYANQRALATILADEERGEEALTIVDRLVEEEGLTLANVATQANVLFKIDRPEDGERAIQRYLATRGQDVDANDYQLLARYRLSMRDLPQAVQAYRQGIAVEDQKTMPLSRELAALLFGRGESELSTALYEKLHNAFPDEESITLRLVESYLRSERMDDARAFLDQQDAQSSTIILLKSELALKQGDREQALRLVNEALELEPDSVAGLVRRANLVGFNDPDAALADLNRVLTLDSSQIQARLLLSDILRRSGDYLGASRELQLVLNRDPRQVQAREKLFSLHMLTGDFSQARSVVDEGHETFPNDTRWHRYIAQAAVRQGRLNEAVQILNEAVELDPNASNIGALLALQTNNNRPDLALNLIDQHPNITANDPGIQAIRGQALAMTGQREAGKRVFTRALERARSYDEMNVIADRVQKSFDVATAIELLVTEMRSREPLWSQLAAARLETNDGRYEDAVSRLRALEGQIEASDRVLRYQLLTLLGRALQLSEAYSDARVAYEKVLELAPSDILTLNNLAYLLGNNLGEPAAAVDFAQRAVNLAPQNANTRDTLGWLQYLNGDLEEARRTLEMSISFSRQPVNQYHLAVVLAELGSDVAATDLLERAIEDAQEQGDTDTLEKARERLQTLTQG